MIFNFIINIAIVIIDALFIITPIINLIKLININYN